MSLFESHSKQKDTVMSERYESVKNNFLFLITNCITLTYWKMNVFLNKEENHSDNLTCLQGTVCKFCVIPLNELGIFLTKIKHRRKIKIKIRLSSNILKSNFDRCYARITHLPRAINVHLCRRLFVIKLFDRRTTVDELAIRPIQLMISI